MKNRVLLGKLDFYIIKKFLGTYVLAISLIISIAVIFDISERFDKFDNATLSEIVFDYYLNFIPFYANTFSALFVFISVIVFTSKLADQSEIIAMLAAGMSFNRLMRPYMISAAIIAATTFFLGSYIIPPANETRLAFQNKYFRDKSTPVVRDVHVRLDKDEIFYIQNYSRRTGSGRNLSLDKLNNKSLVSRLTAEKVTYDSNFIWKLNNYTYRELNLDRELFIDGVNKDTLITILITPEDLLVSINDYEIMTTPELKHYIDRQKKRGLTNLGDVNIVSFEIEYNKRYASIFSAFILTLIGVTLSSRKVKGGMGLNILFGFALSFGYIVFVTISSSFAVSGELSPFMAVWMPNFIYVFIAAFLYKKAPR